MNVHRAKLELVAILANGAPAKNIGPIPPSASEALSATIKLFRRGGYSPPWISYLCVEGNSAAGICGFKTPPCDNRTEIAYFTFPPHEGRGIATFMAQGLIQIARSAAPKVLVTARTLPHENASTTILKKSGMHCFGIVQDPEDGAVWEWHLQTSAQNAC